MIYSNSNRYIPRRIDLDCDFALDMFVSQKFQSESNEKQIKQQRRSRKQSDEQKQTNSAKKTLELLEHFMPQNRRIYNFGVKTLQPRLMGRKKQTNDCIEIKSKFFSSRSK